MGNQTSCSLSDSSDLPPHLRPLPPPNSCLIPGTTTYVPVLDNCDFPPLFTLPSHVLNIPIFVCAYSSNDFSHLLRELTYILQGQWGEHITPNTIAVPYLIKACTPSDLDLIQSAEIAGDLKISPLDPIPIRAPPVADQYYPPLDTDMRSYWLSGHRPLRKDNSGNVKVSSKHYNQAYLTSPVTSYQVFRAPKRYIDNMSQYPSAAYQVYRFKAETEHYRPVSSNLSISMTESPDLKSPKRSFPNENTYDFYEITSTTLPLTPTTTLDDNFDPFLINTNPQYGYGRVKFEKDPNHPIQHFHTYTDYHITFNLQFFCSEFDPSISSSFLNGLSPLTYGPFKEDTPPLAQTSHGIILTNTLNPTQNNPPSIHSNFPQTTASLINDASKMWKMIQNNPFLNYYNENLSTKHSMLNGAPAMVLLLDLRNPQCVLYVQQFSTFLSLLDLGGANTAYSKDTNIMKQGIDTLREQYQQKLQLLVLFTGLDPLDRQYDEVFQILSVKQAISLIKQSFSKLHVEITFQDYPPLVIYTPECTVMSHSDPGFFKTLSSPALLSGANRPRSETIYRIFESFYLDQIINIQKHTSIFAYFQEVYNHFVPLLATHPLLASHNHIRMTNTRILQWSHYRSGNHELDTRAYLLEFGITDFTRGTGLSQVHLCDKKNKTNYLFMKSLHKDLQIHPFQPLPHDFLLFILPKAMTRYKTPSLSLKSILQTAHAVNSTASLSIKEPQEQTNESLFDPILDDTGHFNRISLKIKFIISKDDPLHEAETVQFLDRLMLSEKTSIQSMLTLSTGHDLNGDLNIAGHNNFPQLLALLPLIHSLINSTNGLNRQNTLIDVFSALRGDINAITQKTVENQQNFSEPLGSSLLPSNYGTHLYWLHCPANINRLAIHDELHLVPHAALDLSDNSDDLYFNGVFDQYAPTRAFLDEYSGSDGDYDSKNNEIQKSINNAQKKKKKNNSNNLIASQPTPIHAITHTSLIPITPIIELLNRKSRLFPIFIHHIIPLQLLRFKHGSIFSAQCPQFWCQRSDFTLFDSKYTELLSPLQKMIEDKIGQNNEFSHHNTQNNDHSTHYDEISLSDDFYTHDESSNADVISQPPVSLKDSNLTSNITLSNSMDCISSLNDWFENHDSHLKRIPDLHPSQSFNYTTIYSTYQYTNSSDHDTTVKPTESAISSLNSPVFATNAVVLVIDKVSPVARNELVTLCNAIMNELSRCLTWEKSCKERGFILLCKKCHQSQQLCKTCTLHQKNAKQVGLTTKTYDKPCKPLNAGDIVEIAAFLQLKKDDSSSAWNKMVFYCDSLISGIWVPSETNSMCSPASIPFIMLFTCKNEIIRQVVCQTPFHALQKDLDPSDFFWSTFVQLINVAIVSRIFVKLCEPFGTTTTFIPVSMRNVHLNNEIVSPHPQTFYFPQLIHFIETSSSVPDGPPVHHQLNLYLNLITLASFWDSLHQIEAATAVHYYECIQLAKYLYNNDHTTTLLKKNF